MQSPCRKRCQRRSLRAATDLKALGERQIIVDCDVIEADGGTRTASITGGYIALAMAMKKIQKAKLISAWPITQQVAAISVGKKDGTALLDLNYVEDSSAEVDMNIVMLGSGNFVEVQGTAEGKAFSKKDMDAMVKLAEKGIKELFVLQNKALK